MKEIKIVFMGSPDFGIPILERLHNQFTVVGVVTQPDRPAGRGRKLTPPPVKELAVSLNLEVIQPLSLKDTEALSCLEKWQPDLIAVAAFGQLLQQYVLDLPKYGCLNVHPSLLPRWRGAAPVQAALLHGDKNTGVTIMEMEAGLDTGPIVSQREYPIGEKETALELEARLAREGADLLADTIVDYVAGKLSPITQDDSLATFAERISKEEGRLDLSSPVVALERRVRAFNPWPGTSIPWQSGILKIHEAHVVLDDKSKVGERNVINNLPAVGASGGWLVLDVVQPSGKKPMSGEIFLRGARQWSDIEAD